MQKRYLLPVAIVAVFATWTLLVQHTRGTAQDADVHVSQTFTVKNMTCAACPITVRKAMSRVDGVQSVAVSFKEKTATAIYDPAITNAAAIGDASSSVGFPAQPIDESVP